MASDARETLRLHGRGGVPVGEIADVLAALDEAYSGVLLFLAATDFDTMTFLAAVLRQSDHCPYSRGTAESNRLGAATRRWQPVVVRADSKG